MNLPMFRALIFITAVRNYQQCTYITLHLLVHKMFKQGKLVVYQMATFAL